MGHHRRVSEPRPDDVAGAEDQPVRSRGRRKRRSWARRRHLGLITTGVSLLVLVAGLGIVFLTWDNGRTPLSQQVAALGTSVAPGSSAPAVTAPPTTATTTAAPGETAVRGVIATVGDSEWTIEGNTGLDYTVKVTPTTTFPKKRPFDTYAVGDTIAVKGLLDAGVITATSVSPAR